jgi:hypothetical protein
MVAGLRPVGLRGAALSTPSPDPERSDPVQLRWPGGPRRADVRSTDERGADERGIDERRAGPPPVDDPPGDEPPGAPLRALPVLEADPGDHTPLRRAVVDAYDRLADQVLGRMRALHQDVDADLAEVRSELASLRRSVEDVGDRVQLRQLRTSLDELRTDVAALRRAVLEQADPAEGSAAEQLALLREEVVALRRRIALRAQSDPAAAPGLSDDDVARIAAAVAERLAPPSRRRKGP